MILHSVKNDIVDHSVYLKADGSVDLTGNLSVDAGITIDGVDISEHDHSGAGKGGTVVWASIDKTTSDIADITTKSHTSLSDIGTNTHAQIDSHLADNTQAHSDYLLNNANDETTGTLTIKTDSADALIVKDAAGTNIVFDVSTDDFEGLGIRTRIITPFADNTYDFGTSTFKWRNGYIAGSLKDGTNSPTVANIQTAYDHSQDSTQAHSDYLVNNADDTFDGNLTMGIDKKIRLPGDAGNAAHYIDIYSTSNGLFYLANTDGEDVSIMFKTDTNTANLFGFHAGGTDHANYIQGAGYDAHFFGHAASGETRELRVYGYPTGGALDYGSFKTINTTTDFEIASNRAGSDIILNPANNVVIASDTKAMVYGAGEDTKTYYDGTDLVINSQVVGTGDVLFPNDNQALALGGGSGGDARVYYDGTDLVLSPRVVGTGAVTIGIGAAGVDYVLKFDGETNDGTITYMEDEDRFDFDKDVKVGNDIEVVGELKGGRVIIDGGNNADNTADGYMKFNNGTSFQATLGYRMTRAGSVVGVSFQTNVTAVTTGGTVDMEIRKNGAAVFSTTLTISGTGLQGADSTQARNTDTFVAGDILTFYINFGTFVGTITDTCGIGELQFDT